MKKTLPAILLFILITGLAFGMVSAARKTAAILAAQYDV